MKLKTLLLIHTIGKMFNDPAPDHVPNGSSRTFLGRSLPRTGPGATTRLGVMGTIRGFGSIIVNGLRVTYAPDVPIQIDRQPRTVSDLKVGQVDVTGEGIGPIEMTGGKTFRVLGQTVSIGSKVPK